MIIFHIWNNFASMLYNNICLIFTMLLSFTSNKKDINIPLKKNISVKLNINKYNLDKNDNWDQYVIIDSYIRDNNRFSDMV